MKKMNKLPGILIIAIVLFIAALSCKDNLEGTTYFASDNMTLVQTMEAHPEDFSIYLEILHKTGYYTALQSYGKYTCFVPVNSVWEKYIQERWGVNSIADLTTDEQIEGLKELVKFHTMASRRATSSFIEGRLPDTTFTGDFLVTSYLLGGGIGNVLINREAKLLTFDISADNGIIHTLNKVLTPFSDPIPATMEKAGKHSIFVEALKQTGYYDQWSILEFEGGNKANFTVFAESDSVFALSGINSFEDLAAMLTDTTDYMNESNTLNRFMAYHATTSFLYTSDIPSDGFISTVLPKNAIKVYKTDKLLKVNESETGVNDTWISLLKAYSNLPAKNGVYHTVDTIMNIFVPSAKYIIFDPVSDQPEVQAKMVKSHEQTLPSFYQYVHWYPESKTMRWMAQSVYKNLNRNIFDTGGYVWFELVTPIIPKGKYEMLVCSNGGNSARGIFQIYWDGNPIGPVYDVRTKGTSVGFPDSVAMEANGWRHGYKYITNNAGETQYDAANTMRFIVTKELLCPEQQRHTVRFVAVKAGGMPIDYIEWIPVN